MNKITTDEQFIEELGRKSGMGPIMANYYWFGGELDKSMLHSLGMSLSELNRWIDEKIGYKDDSDDSHRFFQHLYDEGLLSWEAIHYISGGNEIPNDKAFICIWGDGYVDYMASAVIECHGLPFFSEDYGFTNEQTYAIANLNLGGCTEVRGMLEIMSVVRVY